MQRRLGLQGKQERGGVGKGIRQVIVEATVLGLLNLNNVTVYRQCVPFYHVHSQICS